MCPPCLLYYPLPNIASPKQSAAVNACDLDQVVFVDMNNGGSFVAGPPCFNGNCDANPWKVIGSLSTGKDSSTINDIPISGVFMSFVTALEGQGGDLHVQVPGVKVQITMGKLVKKRVEKIAPYSLKKNLGNVLQATPIKFNKVYRVVVQPQEKSLRQNTCKGVDRLVRFISDNSEPTPTLCGNGVVNAGEECDDGNASNADSCTNACSTPVCGNGIVEGTEQCDDDNETNGDGCSSTCAWETLTCTGDAYEDGGGSCAGRNLSTYRGNIVCQDSYSCYGLTIGSTAVKPRSLVCSATYSCGVSEISPSIYHLSPHYF